MPKAKVALAFGPIVRDWAEKHGRGPSPQSRLEDVAHKLNELVEEGGVTGSWLWKVVNYNSQPAPELVRAFAKLSGKPLAVLYEAAGYPQADEVGSLAGLYQPLVDLLRSASLDEQRRLMDLWRMAAAWPTSVLDGDGLDAQNPHTRSNGNVRQDIANEQQMVHSLGTDTAEGEHGRRPGGALGAGRPRRVRRAERRDHVSDGSGREH